MDARSDLRGRGRPARVSRREVAAIALRLFRERGYAATTVAEIAEAAGIGRATFFRHFAHKSEVLWACQAEQVTALERELEKGHGAPKPFAIVANAVLSSVADIAPAEAAVARDQRDVIESCPELALRNPWGARRMQAIQAYIAEELGEAPTSATPVTFAHTVDAAIRAGGVQFAASTRRSLHECLVESLTPIYSGFADLATRTRSRDG